MSSARTAGNHIFHNVGGLTTTWTAPSTCPTVELSRRFLASADDVERVIIPFGLCTRGNFTRECVPRGAEMHDLFDEMFERASTAIPEHQDNYFYSPGLVCPHAWETAGVVSIKDGSVDASGALASTVFKDSRGDPTPLPSSNFPANAFTGVLEPAETAVACCPSGWSVNPYIGCYSTYDVTELAGATGCRLLVEGDIVATARTVVFDYFGTPVTSVQPVHRETQSFEYTTETITMGESGFPTGWPGRWNSEEPAVAMSWVPFLFLVNSGEEETAGPDGDGDPAEGTAGAGGGGNNGSAAARLPSAGLCAVAGAVVAVWALADGWI